MIIVNYTEVWFAPLQIKTLKVFICLLPILVDFTVNTPVGTKCIQAVVGFCPRALKDAVGYRSHNVTYVAFQLVKIVVFDLLGEMGRSVDNTMPDRLIGRGAQIARPARGQQTPFSCFLWGYTKNVVY